MKLGDFNLEVISDGYFSLDGGAMFGVVPKVLWQREVAADSQNRIYLGVNILLIQVKGTNILVDCGVGNKLAPKLAEIYVLDKRERLLESLAKFCLPEQIDYVIPSHLHWDHIGGAINRQPSGTLELTFPKATFIIQQQEWDAALNPHPRDEGIYLKENILLLKESGQVSLINGNSSFMEGIELILTGGHSVGHQIVSISTPEGGALFPGDLIPTEHHLNPLYVMAYDIDPQQTVDQKKKWLAQAAANHWLIFWPHSSKLKKGYVLRDESKSRVKYRATTAK